MANDNFTAGSSSPASVCSGYVEVWEIEPHEQTRFDTCIIPVKDDPDGSKALQHAKDSLERQWDQYDPLDELDIKVRVRRIKMNEEDLPDPDDQ